MYSMMAPTLSPTLPYTRAVVGILFVVRFLLNTNCYSNDGKTFVIFYLNAINVCDPMTL